jgi:hypothetical protein
LEAEFVVSRGIERWLHTTFCLIFEQQDHRQSNPGKQQINPPLLKVEK